MGQPFTFARILEADGHQVLVRCCDHSSQLAEPLARQVPPGPTAMLIIDTYTRVGDDLRALQLPLFMHTPDLLLRVLAAFTEQHARQALRVLLGSFRQAMTREEITRRTQALGEKLRRAADQQQGGGQ